MILPGLLSSLLALTSARQSPQYWAQFALSTQLVPMGFFFCYFFLSQLNHQNSVPSVLLFFFCSLSFPSVFFIRLLFILGFFFPVSITLYFFSFLFSVLDIFSPVVMRVILNLYLKINSVHGTDVLLLCSVRTQEFWCIFLNHSSFPKRHYLDGCHSCHYTLIYVCT